MGTSTMARVRTVFTGVAGTPWYSNLYFDDDGTAAGVYQTKVKDFWTAIFGGHVRSGVVATMENPIAIMNVAGEVVSVVSGDGGTVTGALSNDPLPPATQALLQLHTGVFVAGREVRGRCFIPGLTEADNSTGVPGATLISDIQDAASDLQGASGANGAWVVWSKRNAVWEPVSDMICWNKYAVLRSRRD